MFNEDIYLKVVNNMNDGVYFVDRNRRLTFWNPAAEAISGYKAEEIIGTCCGDNVLCHIDEEGRPICTLQCPLSATMVDGKSRRADVFMRHKQGYRVPVVVNVFPVVEAGEITGAFEIFSVNSDHTYEDNLIQNLSDMAMRDALTGIPNRRYLTSFIEYKLSEFERFGAPFGLLFMDIDHFREFNNNYGHDLGDVVLKAVSNTVRSNARKSDMFGRWGGEEFVGVYSIRGVNDLKPLAEKIRVLVTNTVIPNGDDPLSVTVSLGITSVREGDTLRTIVERADELMYLSKQNGRNRVTVG